MTPSPSAFPYRSILCPVDFSAASREALRCSARLAQRTRGRLTVLYVNDPLLLAAAAAAFHRRRQFLERTRRELAAFVAQTLDTRSSCRDRVHCVLSEGNPAEEILRTARRLGSNLIVMGTHGLSGVNKLFLGSTTEAVVQRAPVAVMALPEFKARRGRRDTSRTGLPVSRVIAPVDFAGRWHSEVRRAADVARALGVPLLLLHVLPRIQLPPWIRLTSETNRRRHEERAIQALERAKTNVCGDVETDVRVVEGNPAEVIAQLASSKPNSLVVMSVRDSRALWHARRGSLTYRVLTLSAAPVLALPKRMQRRPFSSRVFAALTKALAARDKLEMESIDALLSGGRSSRRAAGKPSRSLKRRRAA
jgi:universal stress protein A